MQQTNCNQIWQIALCNSIFVPSHLVFLGNQDVFLIRRGHTISIWTSPPSRTPAMLFRWGFCFFVSSLDQKCNVTLSLVSCHVSSLHALDSSFEADTIYHWTTNCIGDAFPRIQPQFISRFSSSGKGKDPSNDDIGREWRGWRRWRRWRRRKPTNRPTNQQSSCRIRDALKTEIADILNFS